MRSEEMTKWLKTRQHLYSDLVPEENLPLDISPPVVAMLNSEVGEFVEYLENTPYPIWRINTNGFHTEGELERIRELLRYYQLTAYMEDYWDTKQKRWDWSLVITPGVPEEVVEKLNNELRVVGEAEHYNPCLVWRTDRKPDELDELLVQTRKWLEGQPVIPHLSEMWKPDEEPAYYYYNSIAVAPTTNKFDLIRFYNINGGNYDLCTEDIIKELRLLDKQYGLDFIGGAEVQLRRVPKGKELLELEAWFQNFCPDLAFEDEAMTYLTKGRLGFWWD
jgi:hypothetical protein